MSESVRFFDFSKFHGKLPQGSTNIRVNQVIKYWDDAELYKYGEKADVLIFQKVYMLADFQFPRTYPGIKILDICDPDWLSSWIHIVETCNAMDAVTCPTENLATFLRQFHDNVVVIPDRFDIEVIPEPKQHSGKAKTVVWFGYAHNAVLMKPAMKTLDDMNLNLIVISNDDPFLHQWSKRDYHDFYTFVKYNEDTIYDELKKADYALLPEGFRPEDHFKSNNKTIKANLVGLPVARSMEDMELYQDPKNRQKWFDSSYAKIRDEYDVRKSVEQYKDIISRIREIQLNGDL